ncbi:MAG: hypothetical protein PUF70_07395 [Absicoccus porci]|uniref:hypothetical protein n=1 Tax=Absicoccus porci TaxID=2486576 RepID=UPI002408F2A0|nr:hypothetical protein [Absicoccus porci]MDD6460473.1 hypothetical protein [Absicoccus porci]
MNIDTEVYRHVSNRLMKYCIPLSFTQSHLSIRHQDILSRLQKIASFYSQSAIVYEQKEARLTNSNFQDGYLTYTGSIHPHFDNIIKKEGKTITGSGKISYAASQYAYTKNGKYGYVLLNADIGQWKANGAVDIHVWKNKVINPSIYLSGSTSLSLLSGTASARIGQSMIYGTASASGQVGVVYAKAKAVLSASEQTLDLDVGAAALQGEVKSSFQFFDAKITLTGSGSIGSAQANVSYHHKTREWEFGSKLGFICGLGFKVKVEY